MEILARAVGRRKEAVAQVQLVRGNGQFLINDKPAQAYLQNNSCSLICIKSPLQAALSLYSVASPLTIMPEVEQPLVPASSDSDLSAPALLPPKEEREQALVPSSKEEGRGKKREEFAPTDLLQSNPNTSEISAPLTKMPTLLNKSEQSETASLTQENLKLKSEDVSGVGLFKEAESEGVFNWGEREGEIDIIVKVKGGGLIGQAEAIKLGVARAFCIMENVYGGALLRKILKTKGYLTQDSRVKERRKYGLKKARKASQYHKR